jgi:hypothetical protein
MVLLYGTMCTGVMLTLCLWVRRHVKAAASSELFFDGCDDSDGFQNDDDDDKYADEDEDEYEEAAEDKDQNS